MFPHPAYINPHPPPSNATEQKKLKNKIRNMDDAGNGSVADPAYGLAARRGMCEVMEDAAVAVRQLFAIAGSFFHFFAVYDGHGGKTAVRTCTDRMHVVVAEEAERAVPPPEEETTEGWWAYWAEVMGMAFGRVDSEVMEAAERRPARRAAGSTAVVAVVGPRTIAVGNCGNSRAVLYQGGAAIPLSWEHRPNRDDERRRIEAAGGMVIDWNGPRVLGIRTISRSIGDYYLKPYLISAPEVQIIDRSEDDEFLILATDGLWDVVSDELAGDVARYFLSGAAEWDDPQLAGGERTDMAAMTLAREAIDHGSADNISVVVVALKSMGERPPF